MATNSQEPTTPPSEHSSEKPLQGWKEIAAYLERDVRTARRWEKTASLPIRRYHEDRRSSVYAFPSEIETWQRSRGADESSRKTFLGGWAKFAPAVAALALILAGWLLVRSPILNPEQPYAEAANPSGATARQIWADTITDGSGSISRDGRYLAYNAWATGNIAIRDLETGENSLLTNKEDWDWTDYASSPVLSADSSEVAYTWYRYEDGGTPGFELRVVGRDGADDRLIYANTELDYLVPKAWFPGGSHILTWVSRKDRTTQITAISVEDGTLRAIKSLGWSQEGPFRLSPDGQWIAYRSPKGIKMLAADGSAEHSVPLTSEGSEVVDWTPDGEKLLFTSQRTGQKALWSVVVQDGRAQSKPKVLKPDFGARNAVGMASDGSLYYAIRLGGYNVYGAAIDFQSGRIVEAPSILIRSQVARNADPVWSPDGQRLAYKRRTQIRIEDPKNGQGHVVTEFQGFTRLTDWSLDGRFLLCTSYGDKSGRKGMYRIDAATGDTKLIKRDSERFTIEYPRWSRDGKRLYFRRWTPPPKAGTAVWFLDLDSGTEREIFPDAEAVAISPVDSSLALIVREPDEGMRIVIADADGNNERDLLRLKSIESRSYPRWTPNGEFVLYDRVVRKGRHTERQLWAVSVESGETHRLSLDVPGRLGSYSIHPNGKNVAFAANASRDEVWKLENFLLDAATD